MHLSPLAIVAMSLSAMVRHVGLLAILAIGIAPSAAKEPLQYNRDIRPILADKCFTCHGPAKKAGIDLRLDQREVAVKLGAIAPGKPDESELLSRVSSDDDDVRMPPPAAKFGHLGKDQIATLRQWIAEGAEYQPHWSLISLRPVALPNSVPLPNRVASPNGVAPMTEGKPSPIDAIVRESLARRGLALQPEADRATLIRRVTFDITGLPPTPEEVQAFIADTSPKAYERVVDRLLASERYGERMAVDWLDVARYADSYGFQVDRQREAWPWRDWVVASFNRNQPFDQFITWQLAGDLLPNATDEQILATAFNRLHQQESEGGSVEEEYRVEYVCDRVQTFSTAFLGLTMGCCRCHDHKFDPLSQKEYYQFFAMFQNIDEAGLYSYFTDATPTPALALRDKGAAARSAKLDAKVRELDARSADVRRSRRGAFEAWLAARPKEFKTLAEGGPGEAARFTFDQRKGNHLPNSVKGGAPAVIHGENRLVPGKFGQAVEFTGDDPVDLPLGNYERSQPFSVSLWLKTPDFKDRAVVFHRSRAWTDSGSRGYELLIEDGRLKWSLIHFWPGNAISIIAQKPLPLNQWTHVVVASDGSSRAAGLRLYVDGRPAEIKVVRDHLTRQITGGGGDNIALGERFRDRGFKHGAIDDFRVFNRELSPLEALAAFAPEEANAVLARSVKDLSPNDREQLFACYLATVDAEWPKHLEALKAARRQANVAVDEMREIMVMRELPQPKKAYVLFRGQYDQRREEVQPGTPAALPPMAADLPRNRLGLARWLTDRRHPLTARVTVNRFWQSLFGRGLVKTAEDFGTQGSPPSHPELLDWLALRFIDTGWDVKGLLKTIVMSQTYCQRSFADAKTMADDPENEWLARGPRFRLSAEMIRDNALLASGLLNLRVGGAPVNPYEMSESFKPEAPSGGAEVYRRTLYTNWHRTGPPPALVAFDAPRRAVCTARRVRTDTPLQALILLNGEQYVEAARALGQRLYEDSHGDDARMIELGFLRCLSRKPDTKETEIAARLYREQRAYYIAHLDEAKQLLKVGRAPRDAKIPPADLAAATVLGQALLNHDECVVKR
jgi:hypothetical protein